MRRLTLVAALALAATTAACSPEFDPASKIEKLRVLAVRADPPEIDPAGVQTAALTSLVLRADYLTTVRTTTVLHLACVPVPGAEAPTLCAQLSTLKDPTGIVAASARAACARGASADPGGASTTAWPEIDLAGLEVCVQGVCGADAGSGLPPPAVAVPAGFTFAPEVPAELAASPARLAAWHERVAAAQKIGVQGVDLGFALDATPEELLATAAGTGCPIADVADNLARLWARREHVLTVKRVPIRGPASPNPANRNPSVAGIVVAGVTLDPAAATSVNAGADVPVAPILPAGPAGEPEVYTKLDAAGVPIEAKTEEWVYSWFSTQGELKDLRTRSVGKPDKWTVWTSGPAQVVVVVRDLRGGTDWAVRDVIVR